MLGVVVRGRVDLGWEKYGEMVFSVEDEDEERNCGWRAVRWMFVVTLRVNWTIRLSFAWDGGRGIMTPKV
jgi:hypothetical protein